MVFHYTSIDAFRSLVESVEKSKYRDCFVFRATNILYMNDPEEFIYGHKMFVEVLKNIEKELGIGDDFCISNELNNYPIAEDVIKNGNVIDIKRLKNSLPFILSFSTLEDSLPMWLNYGNHGKGVCLAFEDNRNQPLKKRLTPEGEKVFESFYTSDVHYRNIPKDSWLYQTIFDIVKEYGEDVDKGLWGDMRDAYYDALIQIAAPFIKSSFYENEHEVRVAKTIGYDYVGEQSVVEFRCNFNGNIIPYINIEVPVSQLAYVVVGPLADFGLTKVAFEMMLEEHIKNKILIRPSGVKYRLY